MHIVYVDKPYHRVLSVMPEMYDDIWTAAKGMYKMEPAIADGGEVVIYAPHINEISYTHGQDHRRGRLSRARLFRQAVGPFQGLSLGRAGPLDPPAWAWAPTMPRPASRAPRIQVTLATGIPRERCEQVNLGYLDPATIDLDEWQDREDEGILVVPKAGEMLYRVKRQVIDGWVTRLSSRVRMWRQ